MILKNKEATENSHVKLTIEVEKDIFADACAKAYKKNAKDITIPGFRKGKAPRNIIEKMYGKGFFYEDAVNALYREALADAIKEAELDVVSDNIAVEIEAVSEEGFTFTANVPVKPEVSVADYKGIEAEKLIVNVTDEQVAHELEHAQKRGARMTEVDDRAAENGDTAIFDFAGYVDGVAFDGGTAEGYELVLGSGQFIPGFEEQMVGHNIGEEFDVNVKFPEEYHAEELKGKEAVFKIKLHGLKKEELPEIDDDLAADNGFDTLDEYKADIKENLVKRAEAESNRAFDEKLLVALADLVEADIPDEMFDEEADRELEQWAYRLSSQGLSIDDYMKYTGMDVDALRAQFRPQAVTQVKIRLALEKIAELEKFEASEDEIAEEYKKLAEMYQRSEDEIKAAIPEEGVKHDILVEKALGVIRDNAKVNMVEKYAHADGCDCDECNHEEDND